jgi:phospholipase/carboxylesterase
MIDRFSSDSLEQPDRQAGAGESASSSAFAAVPLAAVGCEVLTRDNFAGAAHAEAAALDVDDLYVPQRYEANYAYPLLAWLAPAGGTFGRLQRLMPMISERNYFGVLLPVADPDKIDEHLFDAFLRLRRKYHLHTERVYLVGFGEAGTQALKTALNQPDWFAGVAAISARCPDSPRLLARFDKLRGKRVLLGIEETGNAPVVADCLYMQQLFWSAGMHVTALAASPGRDCRRSLLREIDRWVMQAIEQPELVC